VRRALRLLGWLALGLCACVAAFALLLPRIELGPFVAARASAALGRTVAIESLRVAPGGDVAVTLRGLSVANIPDGTAPEMVRLERLEARIALLPLLGGALVVRDAEAEGFQLLLERDAERRRNWRFGSGEPPAPRPGQGGLPLVHALRMAQAEIVVRTTAGARLVTRIDTLQLTSADPMVATLVEAEGAYNDAPITARIEAGSLSLLPAGAPLPVKLSGRSGDTAMEFNGTARDPLNVDGVDGSLTLAAPTPNAVLRMAQFTLPITLDLRISGHARREGNLWQLHAVEGSLFDVPFTGQELALLEGGAGEPDAITAELDFARIDINRIAGGNGRPGGGSGNDADVPLVVPRVPDPRLDLKLSARRLAYAALDASDVTLVLAQHPERIAIEELQLSVFGARFQGSGALEAIEQGGRLVAAASLLEGELAQLQRAFAARPLPLAGPVRGRLSISAAGGTVNQAFHQADIAVVLAMTGGTIAREVIEMASTDVRALFRTARGTTPLSCLLAVIDMKARRGEASPLRIRAGTGTIVGQGQFDLNRRTLDLVIGTQRDTTDFFALDVPVRVHGPFADPDIALADWSPASRARLGAGDDIAALPPALAEFARANPCYQAPRRR